MMLDAKPLAGGSNPPRGIQSRCGEIVSLATFNGKFRVQFSATAFFFNEMLLMRTVMNILKIREIKDTGAG